MSLFESKETTLLEEDEFVFHNLCAILYGQLQEIVTSDFYNELKHTYFSLDNIDNIPKDSTIEEIIEILVQNNRKEEVIDGIAKRIAYAVIGDFIEFIYESLDAIRHARFSVAYALLRKPFVDELFMLEQIWVDKADFVERYYFQGDPKLYDPSNSTLFDNVRKPFIEAAINKLRFSDDYKVDIIYEFRYDKAVKYGMNWVSNQALHIVTNHSKYKTSNKQLNFVFHNSDDHKNLWKHYYSVVSYLLAYSVDIIDEVIFDFLPNKINKKFIKATRRAIIHAYHNTVLNKGRDEVEELFSILSKELSHTCKTCGNNISFKDKELNAFMFYSVLECPHCKTDQLTDSEFQDKFLLLG